MQEVRGNYFNVVGNRAALANNKFSIQFRSKQTIKPKSKEHLKILKPLKEEMKPRALTTNKRQQLLAPLDEIETTNPFRYNLMQLIVLVGRKEYYLDRVSKDELKTIFQGQQTLPIDDAMAKIKKFLSNKVRYKYRQTFRMREQIQLELHKYNVKKKSLKTKEYQEPLEEEEDTPRKKRLPQKQYPDYTTWKKKNEVTPNQKVFIIRTPNQDVKDSLLERGWVENDDPYSPFFDFKWTCALHPEDYVNLFDYQIINHFDNNQCLTSKYGLCRNIRCIPNCNQFFPRCYDLGDLTDFSDFVEDFKISKTYSILLAFLESQETEFSYRDRYRIRMSLLIQLRVNKPMKEMVRCILKDDFPLVHPGEWLSMFREPEKNRDLQLQQEMEIILSSCHLEDLNHGFVDKYRPLTQTVMENFLQSPEAQLQGTRNIWIIKPECIIITNQDSSRGRGIRCFDDLYAIFDHVVGKENGYVAQKYIERPLIIRGRKFDLRQWVTVTELVPLKIYFYNQCYVRFSAEEYTLDDLSNRYAHLTNNAIAKHSSQFHQSEIKGNMWTQDNLRQHLQETYNQDVFAKIQKQMKEIIIASLRACSDQMKNRKRSFEVFGYDFMIDSNFGAWLIEVNMSPSTDTSTEVTAEIIPKMMEDIIKLVVDKKKKHGFTLIYNG